jgi:hypothetical protein
MTMSDCIIWHKSKNEKGYGQDFLEGKKLKAHRAAWIRVNGKIPAGMVIDHVCHNEAAYKGECQGGDTCLHRACVNIEHLRMTTQGENLRSGLHGVRTKATCPKGHDYRDPNNIMVRKNGKQECAQCNRERATMNYLKSKQVAA